MTEPPTLAHRTAAYPLAAAMIQHSLAQLGERRMPGLLRAYADQAEAFFQDIETETAAVLHASGQTLAQCLHDLDAFNALTPETENDAWYDHPPAFTSMHLDALLLGFSRRRLGVMVDQLSEPSIEHAVVLDVGSGSGRLAGLLLREHPAWHAALVDRSRAAVQFSRAHLEATGRGNRADCRHGDLAAIPFADARFDVVIAAEVLEHTHDAHAGAAELLRVLKPGGRLVISLPIDLDIAMHPTVFATEDAILQFFGALPLTLLHRETVRPDPTLDAICDVFPDFKGCLNTTFVRYARS
ncbi:MAG TPA: class I SAM-dependent methyltransferase [Burkholderiaceae bacterium]|nr:class I SAM-dependent methyltransferase [Burkholderiaceae bacterium]